MKTAIQWTTICAAFLALALLSTLARAQTVPAIQGTSVADPSVPVLVTPAPSGSGFFVLNQDFSLLQHSTVDSSQNQSCNGPGIFSRTNPAPRTLVADLYNAYFTGPDGSGANTAIDALTPEVSCTPVQAFDYTGGLSQQSISSNDPPHALFYTVSAFEGAGGNSDELIVLQNLNYATVSQTNKFTELNEASLDIGGVYTSINSDTRSNFGLTAITELKTDSSPGNLWIYYPQTNFVYKILGPGGKPLPAVTSFIIPPQTDGGGSLLLLVNQDGLTNSNLSAPPQDTTPFTIIDLGQLRPLLDAAKPGGTITLPFVTQITATTSFYAMLGGAYNPLDHRVYVMVAGGTSATNVVENILSYDTLNPAAPGELVVADVSNVMLSEGYPQLALNAASGTMQILPAGSGTLYSVGITGTGNTAVVVPGSTFPDSNFTPTYIAANALQGETYIASSSGQVDVLTRPATLQGGLTLTLTGPDLGYTSQEYQVTPQAFWPVYDDSLATAKLTITVTPRGGTPVTLATGHIADVGYPGTSFYTYTFPAPGQYTIVATADASALYPAVTSPPLNVFVGNTGVYETAVSLSIPATAPSSNGEAQLNATVTLTGTTYGPTGQVYIQDPTGAEVGNVQLPKGVIANPITVPIVIGDGVQTLTAVYSGDDQNQSSKSAPQTITVGTVAKVTPTFTVTVPGTAKTGASVAGNVKFTASSTTAPTGTVTIYATLAGSTTANQIATVTAAEAFASGGASFNFTAPAAGSYTVFAGYGGDTNYNNAVSPSVTIAISGATLQTTAVGIVAPATASAGTAFNLVVAFNVEGAFTTQPTGNVVVTATSAGGPAIPLGTITPAQGMAPGGANIPVTLTSAGTYTLNANYAGDSTYAASSNAAYITVGPATKVTPTLSLFAPDTQNAGTIANATISFISTSTTAPTGKITIYATAIGSTTQIPLTTVPAANAVGGTVYTFTEPGAGSYTLCASYAGDTTYNSAVSNCATLTVNSATTISTTLKLKVPGTVGAGTSFNAIILLSTGTVSSTAPTGNVIATSTSGTTTTTVATITAAQALTPGGHTASISLPAASQYLLNATYAGDANYAASSTSALVAATQTPTTLGISAPSTIAAGSLFTATATLKAAGTQSATITGNVIISAQGTGTTSGSYVLGTMTAAQASSAVGGAQFTVAIPTPGTYTVSANYAGDANYAPSSGATAIAVSLAPTITTVTTDLPDVTLGKTFTTTATLVSTANSTPAPSGTVVVTTTRGGVTIATTTLSAAAAMRGASMTSTPTTAGAYTITATYSGDANHLSSAGSLIVTVSTLPIPTLQFVGPPQGLVSTPVNIVFQLTDDANKPIVSSGLITITSTLNGVGGPSTTIQASTTNATLTFRTAGEYKLFGSFAGDSNYGPARSDTYDNSYSVKIYTEATLPGFTLQTQDPTLTVTSPPIHIPYSGQTAVPMLTAPVHGFVGALQISVTAVQTNRDTSSLDSTLKGGAATLKTQILDAKGNEIGFDKANINVGDQFSVVVDGSLPRANVAYSPTARNGGVFTCFLFGMLCLRSKLRKRSQGVLKTFAAVLLILCLGTLTPGCGIVSHDYTITVTAVSTDLGLTKTVSFPIVQDPGQ